MPDLRGSGRVRAEALNLAGKLTMRAGRLVYRVGSRLRKVGLALGGVAGTLDARADEAGYWTWHR